MKLTVSMPCYGRPKRTIRAIESIVNQNMNGWEALVVGDGCSVMQDFIFSNTFSDIVRDANARGNDLRISNNSENKGGCGYAITNQNIQRAKGEYFIFMSNDDVIKQNHFENYLSGIVNTDNDFVYFNSWVEPYNAPRTAALSFGNIGHSELIVRTEFLRNMPPHYDEYGHDWQLVLNMLNSGAKYHYAGYNERTYIVKSVPNKEELNID
jgi:glycosyltransferase involved in cell wall biosynthesis